jgi:hypothetical protein
MEQREVREGKDVQEVRLCGGVLCLERIRVNVFQ